MLAFGASLLLCAASAQAQSLPPHVASGPLLPLILQVPQGGWLRVNFNRFQDVWTPVDLRPLKVGDPAPPERIILAWSGFGWDSNRGDILLYGGGHANYSGNDVYRWRSGTLTWERASLPSEIYNDPVSGYQAIDGVDAAPSSAHTYDNNMFLPVADRFLTWGGAAYTTGVRTIGSPRRIRHKFGRWAPIFSTLPRRTATKSAEPPARMCRGLHRSRNRRREYVGKP